MMEKMTILPKLMTKSEDMKVEEETEDFEDDFIQSPDY